MGLVGKNRVNGKEMTSRRIDEEAVEEPIGRAEGDGRRLFWSSSSDKNREARGERVRPGE